MSEEQKPIISRTEVENKPLSEEKNLQNGDISSGKAANNEQLTETKKKSNFRVFVLFVILDLALFAVILWQIITLFIDFLSLS